MIVAAAPGRDDQSGMAQVAKPVRIEAFVSQPPAVIPTKRESSSRSPTQRGMTLKLHNACAAPLTRSVPDIPTALSCRN